MNEDVFPEELAIRVRGVSKTYRLGVINRRTFRDELVYRYLRLRGMDPRKTMGRIDGIETASSGLFHALDNVSFDIRRGETVGLIGRNGAGKSTMLKILARITTPTAGDTWLRGRVGSMLEVGTGFHPELTGRENIYLNGTVLGMSKQEIDAKFDEIVDFSEIGDFLDTPVKRYSSGMYVKLAFSVASSLDTDILLLDEVLAVGDAAFQQKSLSRMKEIAASGRTIIFVSHNMANIKAICSRCLLFDQGRLVYDGVRSRVCAIYEELSALPFIPASDILRPVADDGTFPVCLFRSQKDGRHFLSGNRTEMKRILRTIPDLKCEGVAFRAYGEERPGTVPLFRFISSFGGRHAFVPGRCGLENTLSKSGAWSLEKAVCYVFPDRRPGTVPVYRFQNPAGLMFRYAVGDAQRDSILTRSGGFEVMPGGPFYAFPPSSMSANVAAETHLAEITLG